MTSTDNERNCRPASILRRCGTSGMRWQPRLAARINNGPRVPACLRFTTRPWILLVCLLTALAVPALGETEQPSQADLLARAAVDQVGKTTKYDPSYVRLAYPGGDVPMDRGVCSDVIVRAFRRLGVDLQVLIHEDMAKSFGAYPQRWGLRAPDPNIDHRRVLNIATYFRRKGKAVSVTGNAADYRPGDVVVWRLWRELYHIGIVSGDRVPGTQRHAIVHNIGAGARLEDVLFSYETTGHFRYF